MRIPKYIKEMSDDEFLESLDEYGDGHHYAHEAANRIRKLKQKLDSMEETIRTQAEMLQIKAQYGSY